MKSNISQDRYQRQLTLPGFGEAAQQALLNGKVLIIGAGGLGCPVLQYLTAAGVGCIGIVDNDVVSVSNLHRQVLYDSDNIGNSKVLVAAAKLKRMNPDANFIPYPIYLNNLNCLEIINLYDVIVDCTDNFATRYMINDACILKGKPLIFGAVNQFEGQIAVFNLTRKDGSISGNYRDLFPVQPKTGEIKNCAEAGVLGVLTGIIGSMLANETIKVLTGVGNPLVNQLLNYNALNNRQFLFDYASNELTQNIPLNEAAFRSMEYDQETNSRTQLNIGSEKFELLAGQKNALWIDVREPHELPLVTEFEIINIPLVELKAKLPELQGDIIIFLCQSGTRSLIAAEMAVDYFGNTDRFFSVKEGIQGLKKWLKKEEV